MKIEHTLKQRRIHVHAGWVASLSACALLLGCDVPPPYVEQGESEPVPVTHTATEQTAPRPAASEPAALPPPIPSRTPVSTAAPAALPDAEVLEALPLETWTNLRGDEIHAAFITIEDPFVVLRAEDNQVIRVPLNHLSEASATRAKTAK